MSNGEELSQYDDLLAPCPLCGSKAFMDGRWFACCSNVVCLCSVATHASAEKAVAAWNKRAPSSAAVEAAEVSEAEFNELEAALSVPVAPTQSIMDGAALLRKVYTFPPPASPSAPQGVAELRERLLNDEALADALHAELKRQQAFTIEKHGKIALAVAPFIDLILSAIQTSPEAGR